MTSPRTLTRMIRRLDNRRRANRADQPHRHAERRIALATARRIAIELRDEKRQSAEGRA